MQTKYRSITLRTILTRGIESTRNGTFLLKFADRRKQSVNILGSQTQCKATLVQLFKTLQNGTVCTSYQKEQNFSLRVKETQSRIEIIRCSSKTLSSKILKVSSSEQNSFYADHAYLGASEIQHNYPSNLLLEQVH